MATPQSLRHKLESPEWEMSGKRKTLLTLDLSGHGLTRLPDELYDLEELEALVLDRNKGIKLSNELTKLTNLKVLSLDSCSLDKIPAVVTKLQKLEALYLNNNKTIALPDEMSRLNSLTVLDLDGCNLVTVPDVVMKLTQLEALDLSHNKNITLPDEMSGLSNLAILDLKGCDLDTLPPQVWRLTQLEELDLSYNPLQTLPAEVGQLTNVKHLDLSWCQLRTLPPEVGRLTQLEWLNLRYNPLQTLPAEVGQLTNVEHLDLSDCKLGTLPPEVGRLTQLERLDLRFNPLQKLPTEVGQLTNVKHLDLSRCQLRILPPEVWGLTQLEWLELTANPLQTLPAEVGQLINVKHLNLADCQLRTLPPEMWRFTQLEWLNVSYNPLQTLPAEIGQLTNVKHLDLAYCQLRILPPELWKLTQLEWLELSLNPLQRLPTEVGQLTNVKHLDLSDCQLHTLPPEVGTLTQLEQLDLSSNTLQTLPSEIGQLTNAKHLDLSDCELHTLPPEVGRLTQLERLDLSFNPLQTLPAEVGQLTNVKHLNLSRCQLHTLPPEVGRLTQLERLGLEENNLTDIPQEIGLLCNVGELNQSTNKSTSLPGKMSAMVGLKELNFAGNKLTHLPDTICSLQNLETFNARRNQIVALPAKFGQLKNLRDLDVSGNRLVKPPPEVCNQGIIAIKEYFDELERSEEAVSARLKIVVLGETMAGKTSLVRTLRRGNSSLTEEADRTHCVEITQWAPDDSISFEVYDFGGHEVYHLTHQFFLTPDALYLLLVNLHTYSCTDESYTEAVGFWLDTLNARVPGAVVTVVGSKKDLCRYDEEEEKTKDIKDRILGQRHTWRRHLEEQLSRLKTMESEHEFVENVHRQIAHLNDLLNHDLRIVGDVICVSVKPEPQHYGNVTASLPAWSELKDFLLETGNDTALFPTLKRVLPRTWVDFEKQLRKKDVAADGGGSSNETSSVNSDNSSDLSDLDDSSDDTGSTDMGNITGEPHIQQWMTLADCARFGQFAGLSPDRLEPVLSYLQQVGTIVRYTDIPELKDFVFHDPSALTEFFKDLFHHDTKALFSTPGVQKNYTRQQLSNFEQDLCERGLIRKDVMTYLLPSNINSDAVAALILRFGLCFKIQVERKTDPSKHTCWYRIPWYLHGQMPQKLKRAWPKDVTDDQEQLQLMCDIRGFCPRGLFQRFSVGIHGIVKYRKDWKDGVLAYRKDFPIMVCSKPVEEDIYITMATRGSLAQADEMWGVVHPLLEVLVQLLQEWPGVLYSLHVTCAHCIKAGLDNPHQFDLRDRTADDDGYVRCERVDFTASTSADLVYKPLAGSNKRKRGHQGPSPLAKVPGPSRVPIVLLLNDEYGTSKGGISTINCQMGKILTKAKAVVYCTALRVPEEDRKAADRDGVKLIEPDLLGKKTEPTLDWLTYYHSVHYQNLPPDITCIIGHADITDTAARNIWEQRYPQADLMTFNHVIPEDTEYYKGGRKAMKAWEKEKDMLDKCNDAKAAFSVGKRIHDHFDTMYKGDKKPQNHYIFLPKPSDLFLAVNVRPGGGQKVVLTVGRVSKVEKLKGHDLAARAVGEVVKEVKNTRLRVRGISEDDWETSKKILEDNLNSPDLNPTLLPYGTQEDIRDDMMTAHLVLMPSRSEPFGLVGLEAMAAGIPVLISDKSGLAEMILDLIDKKKLSPEHRHVIVETSVNDSNRDKDAKRWAERIVDILKHSDSEFEKAARFKRELMESRYWEESHRTLLQACGITAGDPD